MSLRLDAHPKTDPDIMVKTYGVGDLVDVVVLRTTHDESNIGFSDFFAAVKYVLQNTNLEPNDARLAFCEWARKLEQVPGHGGEGVKLGVPSEEPQRA